MLGDGALLRCTSAGHAGRPWCSRTPASDARQRIAARRQVYRVTVALNGARTARRKEWVAHAKKELQKIAMRQNAVARWKQVASGEQISRWYLAEDGRMATRREYEEVPPRKLEVQHAR